MNCLTLDYYLYIIPSSQLVVTLEREQEEETTGKYCELVSSLSFISAMVFLQPLPHMYIP